MGGPRQSGPDEAEDDARLFGIPEDAIAAACGRAEQSRDIALWPENVAIVTAFASIAGQWRTAALPCGHIHYLGLDYAAVRARLGNQLDANPELWPGIETMESDAREVMNKR